MSCTHHYIIIQDSSAALKMSCASPVYASFLLSIPCSPLPLETTIFTVEIVFTFPESHKIGIIQSVDFSDQLFSLRNVHLSVLHVFSWFDSSFLTLNNIPISRCTTVYLSIHLPKDILFASRFWQL